MSIQKKCEEEQTRTDLSKLELTAYTDFRIPRANHSLVAVDCSPVGCQNEPVWEPSAKVEPVSCGYSIWALGHVGKCPAIQHWKFPKLDD